MLQLPLRVREVILGVHTRQPPSTRRSRAERWRYVNTACLCSSGCGLERKVVLHAPNSPHTDTYTQLPYTPHTTTRSANSRVHQTTQRAEAAAPNNMPSRSPNFGGAPPQGTGLGGEARIGGAGEPIHVSGAVRAPAAPRGTGPANAEAWAAESRNAELGAASGAAAVPRQIDETGHDVRVLCVV